MILETKKALEGLKILDFTRVYSGPYCTMLLADLGAEVIKVEAPKKGDDTRMFAPIRQGESGYFMYLNRCKKSITLDLKQKEGKKIAKELAQWADVVIENFSPGTMEKLELDYERIKKVNPEIIYASISGTELWPDDLRLRLVELATEEYPRFRSSDFEFHLPRPSYSVHTLEKLHETYPERDFYLIIGSDNWARFDRWYQSERIIKENRILIYPRPGFPVNENGLPETVRLVHSPTFEISSTFIRQALDEKKDVRYFLHPKVWEYIREYIRQSITDN